MNVFAYLDLGHHAADVMAVFDDGVVLFELGQGDLVPQGDVLQGLDLDLLLAVHVQPAGLLPRLDVDGGHADIVGFFVNQELNHVLLLLVVVDGIVESPVSAWSVSPWREGLALRIRALNEAAWVNG